MAAASLEDDLLEGWTPPECSDEALRWLLSQLSSEALLRLARFVVEEIRNGRAFSGFRLTREALERPEARRSIELDLLPVLRRVPKTRTMIFLASFPSGRWFRWAEALAAHEEAWLVAEWRRLVRATGDPALAVAFALDERPRLAERGARLLGTRTLWASPPEAVPSNLPEAWSALCGLLGPMGCGAAPEPRDKRGNGPNARAFEELQAEAKKASKELAKARRLKDRLEARGHELENEVREGREEIARLSRALRETEERLSAIGRDQDIRLRQEVARLYQELCMAPQIDAALWQESLEGEGEALVEKTHRALERQARVDSRLGRRSEIRRRLAQLSKALDDVDQALSDTLAPAKGLVSLRDELEAAMARDRGLLGERSPALSAFAKRLVARARATDLTQEGLEEIGRLLDHLEELRREGLLAPAEAQGLREHLAGLRRERTGLLQTLFVDAEAAPPAPGDGPQEVANLAAFVHHHRDLCARAVLFVDGYNVIKASTEWAQWERRDFAGARDRFRQLWRERSRDWGQVELVFDGQGDAPMLQDEGRLAVIFTDDRYASQRADLHILARLRQVKAEAPDRPVFLMTADAELRQRAASESDYFIDPRWAAIHYLTRG